MVRLEEKIRGGIYGLLIGDAVGVPYEFNSPALLPSYDQIDIISPPHFKKTYPNIALEHGQMMVLKHFVCWHRYYIAEYLIPKIW